MIKHGLPSFLILSAAVLVTAQEPTTCPPGGAEPGGQSRRAWDAIVLKEDDKPAFPEPPVGWDQRREAIPHGKLEMIDYESKAVHAPL